jgi:membrane protein
MSQQLKLNLAYFVRAMAARERELRLGQTAASLSFISLLAMVPLLTVVLATLASVPVFSHILDAVQLMLVQHLLPDGFANMIYRYLHQFVAKARTLSLIGIGFLLVTATIMMLTLDRTLNLIWRVKTPRPLLHRLSVYWLALILGPILVGAGAALAIFVAGGKRAMADSMIGIQWWDVANLCLTVSAFALCYRWIPNVDVRWRDALIGAAAGAVLSELARLAFFGYFTAVPTYQQVYGPLAAIPALLIWAYLTWWVFLAGALLASILPNWRAVSARISAGKTTVGDKT